MTPDTIRLPKETMEAVKEALKVFRCSGEDCSCAQRHYSQQQQSRCFNYKAAAALALLEQELKNNG